MCDKRPYKSKLAAREAVKAMGNTIRVYMCNDCHDYHVTKDRGGNPSVKHSAWSRRKRAADRRRKLND